MLSPKAAMFFKVLLNRFEGGRQDQISKILPSELVQEIKSLNLDFSNPEICFIHPKEFFQHIHYSWFLPLLQPFPEALKVLFLSTFNEKAQSRLKSLLKIAKPLPSLNEPYKHFVLDYFYQRTDFKKILPIPFLEKTHLTPLLDLSKDELIVLMDFLGLYDLAEDIRHILDRKLLKVIQDCLSPSKQQFLKICLKQKQRRVKTAKLGLEKWDGNCQTLQALLHRRGLIRLGKALCLHQPDFIWHLTHILDTGRGELLAKHASIQENPAVVSILIQQVTYIHQLISKGKAKQ